MTVPRLKSLLPRSLYGRAALILIVPIVTIQLVVSIAFIQRHFEAVTRQLTAGVVLELLVVLGAADAMPGDPVAGAARVAAPLGLRVAPGEGARPGFRRDAWDLSGRIVIEEIGAGVPGVEGIDLSAHRGEVRILIDRYGDMLLVSADRRRVSASNPHQLLVWMIFFGVLMTFIAFLFLRNQLRPIKRLARVADSFGKGRSDPYRPSGALEVRAAGTAFLDMRSRIERQIEQRTLLLSGVSHDLRTPLTRLKLGLAMIEDRAEAAALEGDVAEMERMLDGFLAFARSDATETPAPADPVALVRRVVEDARRTGQDVVLLPPGEGAETPVPIRADAVARAVGNLVGNAARHAGRAEVSVIAGERSLRIVVEDDGPGIPKERREEAMRPFTRLDAARDPNRGGGVGLGLAIAADVARSHGGALRLGESGRLGGLRAELALAR